MIEMRRVDLEKEVRELLNEGLNEKYYQIDDSIWWEREVSIHDAMNGVIRSYGARLYLEKSEGMIFLHCDVANSYESGYMADEDMDTLVVCPYEKDNLEGGVKKFIDKVLEKEPWILD